MPQQEIRPIMANIKIKDPYIGLYAFFITKSSKEMVKVANQWGEDIKGRLNIPIFQDDGISYQNTTLQSRVDIYSYDEDCRVVYVILKKEGTYDINVWNDLSTSLLGNKWELRPFGKVDDLLSHELHGELYNRICNEELSESLLEILNFKVKAKELSASTYQEFLKRRLFFGCTVFLGAEQIEGGIEGCLENIKLPFLSQSTNPPVRISKGHAWGDLYQLSWRQAGKAKYYPQVYAILSTSEQIKNNVPPIYSARNFDRIELSLHKCYYYIEFYHRSLTSSENPLEIDLKNTLKNIKSQLEPPTPEKLVNLSNTYIDFFRKLSYTTIAKTNLETNKTNLETNLIRVGFQPTSDAIYVGHINRIERMITQIDTDIIQEKIINEQLTVQLDTLNTTSQLLVETRERIRDKKLAWIGIGLGLVQAWQIIQGILKVIIPTLLPESILMTSYKDTFFVSIDFLFLMILGYWLWNRNKQLQSGGK